MEAQTRRRIPDFGGFYCWKDYHDYLGNFVHQSTCRDACRHRCLFRGLLADRGHFFTHPDFYHSGLAPRPWSLLSGILGIVAGILVLAQPMLSSLILTTTLVIIIAIQGILIGILDIVRGAQGDGAGAIVLGILSAIIGIWLLVNASEAALALPVLLGIFTLIDGALLIYFAFRMRKFFEEYLP